MYIKEYLAFVAGFYGIKGKQAKNRVEELIEMCGLQVEQHKIINQLSKGYRQRVGLAQALIHDPSVLILDEPTSGLDPNQIVEIRNLIRSVSANKTVILSTHIMQEVQAMCDHVVIINKGKVVANDKTVNLVQSGNESNLTLSFGSSIDAHVLKEVSGVEKLTILSDVLIEIQIEEGQTKKVRSEVYKLAGEHEWDLLEVKETHGSLEDVFHEFTIDKKA
jgi:ABC-2 type transport system ATP-binding protein